MNLKEIHRGDVWEGRYGVRREVMDLTPAGEVATKNLRTGAVFCWARCLNSEWIFRKLISRVSKPDAIHAYGLCRLPGPGFRYRCMDDRMESFCRRESHMPECGDKHPAKAVWEMAGRNVTVSFDPPSKIDSVKEGQVWKGVDDGDRRRIVGTSSSEKGIVAITTINLEFSRLQQKEVRWTRAEAQFLVLGELIEVEDVKCVYCGKVTGHVPPLMSGSFSCCADCRRHLVPCEACKGLFFPGAARPGGHLCPKCECEGIEELKKPKPAKIDTVEVHQVWKSTQEKFLREIVSVTRHYNKVTGIGTRRLNDGEPASWDREQAERVVLGELVEDVPPEPEGEKCQACGKRGPDRRTLWMANGSDMGGLHITFKNITLPEVDYPFYTLRVCKDCRAEWMGAIQKWFEERG